MLKDNCQETNSTVDVNSKEKRPDICICTHSKKTHVPDFDNTRCCATWKSKLNGDTKMCECMEYNE